MTGLSVLWQRLVVEQWRALKRDYPVVADPSGVQAAQVLGLYLVAGLVLTANTFGAMPGARYLALHTMPSDWTAIVRRSVWALNVSFGYIVPTALYCRYALGMSLGDLGLRLRGFVEHAPLYLAFAAVVSPFVVYASSLETFQHTYPMAPTAHHSLLFLAMWLICYAIQFVGVEFFFRGFLLFGAARVMGPWGLPVMLVPYMMIHFQKPFLEALGSAIAGLALGVVALRTRSILAGVAIHVFVAWSMDLLVLYHRGDLLPLLLGGRG